MAKYYAVRQGVKPGIYKTWEDCQMQVKGYKGAEYKSFKDISEAEEYVFGKAKVVQEAFKITINLDEEETDEFKYLLTTMKNSDSLEEIKDLIGNMEDLVGPII